MAATDIMRSQHVPQLLFPSAPSALGSSSSSSRKRGHSSISHNPAMKLSGNSKPSFDASKHLCHVPPAKVYTMEEIGRGNEGVSPIAVSVPFPMFTEEAVSRMREEIFSKDVLENCRYSSEINACQLRGYASRYAPFVYEAWHSPEVLEIVSKIAGIGLVPAIDFEIGHINIFVNTPEKEQAALQKIREGGVNCEDDTPIVDWHTDSYPFVCVLMLSDCTNMVGGETALRTGSGEIMKVRGPGMGNAVILQGRYIEHQALRTLGGSERITMVTSFRPKSAIAQDDTVLTTVRPISDLSELYEQYSEYRLEVLEERIRDQMKNLRARKQANRGFDTTAVKEFLAAQKAYIDSMLIQIVDDDKVTQSVEEGGATSSSLIEATNKRAKMAHREQKDE